MDGGEIFKESGIYSKILAFGMAILFAFDIFLYFKIQENVVNIITNKTAISSSKHVIELKLKEIDTNIKLADQKFQYWSIQVTKELKELNDKSKNKVYRGKVYNPDN